jgi:heptaprenyl diphosphate synthase
MFTEYENLRRDIDSIKNKVLDKIRNNYLLTYTDIPIIDDDKILLLYMMYKEKRIAQTTFEDYIITVMLVQVALDTHESISIHQLKDDISKKNRQLTVLAGDYYSSLYYQILAELSELSMIRILAQGIQEINENKMQFYQTEVQEIENAIENIRRIEASLLLRTADSLHLPLWKGIAEEFLFIKRLLRERNQFKQGTLSPLFVKISKQLQIDNTRSNYKKQAVKVVDGYIERARLRIEKFLAEQPVMENVLKRRLESLFEESGSTLEKTAEEG